MSTIAKPLDFVRPHVLRNTREYRAAVNEIDALLDRDPPKGSEDHQRLEFLSVLVEAYEDTRVTPLRTATPQEAVDFMLEQKGMTRADLAPHLGGRSRVSEFFAHKRNLSLAQVEALRNQLGIPADLLIAQRPPTRDQETTRTASTARLKQKGSRRPVRARSSES